MYVLAQGDLSRDWQGEIGVRVAWLTGQGPVVAPRVLVQWSGLRSWWLTASAGTYLQAPFYREYFQEDTLRTDVTFQRAHQVSVQGERSLSVWGKPFQCLLAVYGRWLTHLIQYTLSEALIQYWGTNVGRGYVVGAEFRLSGELVAGTPSWLSFSVLQAREQFPVDSGRWVPRPTDERFRLALFLLDEFPRLPALKFTTTIIYGSGFPFSPPQETKGYARWRNRFRMAPYFRVDLGFRLVFRDVDGGVLKRNLALRWVREAWLELSVYNLLDRGNVSAYWWMNDLNGLYYAIPRRLTGRTLNLRLAVVW